MNLDFEKAFSDYLDSESYDNAEDVLFSVIRTAFLAGWNAAGKSCIKQKVIQFKDKDTNKD